jgi:hypothetical protein
MKRMKLELVRHLLGENILQNEKNKVIGENNVIYAKRHPKRYKQYF